MINYRIRFRIDGGPNLNLERFINVLEKAKEKAKKTYQRRLIVILGNYLIERIISEGIDHFLTESSLVVSDDKRIPNLVSKKMTFVELKETKKILGRTFDNALIDLRWYPDVISLSRAIETVKGGGLIFLLLPLSYINSRRYIEELVPIGEKRPPRDILRRRLLKLALEMPLIYVFSSYSLSFIRIPNESEIFREIYQKKIEPPVNRVFDKNLYLICATQDQMNALKAFEEIDTHDTLLITADRGRGKSAIVGIGLTGIAVRRFRDSNIVTRALITAPEKENCEEIFRFLAKSHDALSIPYRLKDFEFSSKIINAKYVPPYDIVHSDADIIIVDEAAGLQFPLLSRIIKRKRPIIFSTTIHGYEGSGRTFSVRFIPLLKQERKTLKWITLNEPIRYALNDPVEAWLFKALLLDAEPCEVNESILEKISEARLVELNPLDLFLKPKNADILRNFFGILVTAHYRNNPKDALLIADAPHHKAYALVIDEKILVALQICMEGNLSESEISLLYTTAPSSHIVPDKIFKYYGLVDFPSLKGWRIVRIATHPRLFRKGLGSLALKKLIEIAMKEGIDWIAAGFSSYPELLSFWLKNNFIPIHLSPVVNRTTGEHTIIVGLPISDKATSAFKLANKELKRRLLEELSSTFKRLDTETARLILKSGEAINSFESLSPAQLFRLNLYLREVFHYESASDSIRALVRMYFGRGMGFLAPEEEVIIIKAILKNARLSIREILKLRSIIKRIWKHSIK